MKPPRKPPSNLKPMTKAEREAQIAEFVAKKPPPAPVPTPPAEPTETAASLGEFPDIHVLGSKQQRSVAWEPQVKQRLAMGFDADEVFMGGLKGGGKTDAVLMRCGRLLEAAQRRYEETGVAQSGVRYVIFRKTLKEAIGMISRSKALYPLLDPEMGIDGFNKTKNQWTFTSGAQVIFAHLDGPDDHMNWNGVAITGLGFDQLEECCPKNVYKFLVAQVRPEDPYYAPYLFVFATGNPGGRYAEWVYEYFVEPNEDGYTTLTETVETTVDGIATTADRKRVFIKVRLSDNWYLHHDGKYEANLRTLSPEEQAWYLHGKWGTSVASYFTGILDKSEHFAEPPAKIPDTYERLLGIKWAEHDIACCLFAVRDPQDRIWFIDEEYSHGKAPAKYMALILAKLGVLGWPVREMLGVIDATADKNVEASVGPTLRALGLSVTASTEDRVTGWRAMRDRMLTEPSRFHVSAACPNLRKELARVMPDDKKTGDVDTKTPTHAVSAARVICTRWPLDRWLNVDQDAAVEAWHARVADYG